MDVKTEETLNEEIINPTSTRTPLILLVVTLVIFSGAIGYFLGLRKSSSTNLQTQNQVNSHQQETLTTPEQDQFEMSSVFYIGPKPYQLTYEYDWDSEQGRIWLQSTADENEKYLLREEDAFVGDQDHIKFSPSNSKFILTRTLGDTKQIVLFEVEIEVDQVSGPGSLTVLSLQDSYGEFFHKIISWIDESHVLISKQYYDQNLDREYYVAPIDNLENIRQVNLIN